MTEATQDQPAPTAPKRFYQATVDHPWTLWVLGALVFVAFAWFWQRSSPSQFTSVFDSLVTTDLKQQRIDTALPVPNSQVVIEQSLVPRRNGMTEIELTLVRRDDPPANDHGRLDFQLFDEQGALIAEQSLMTDGQAHNDLFQISFAALPDSAGQSYLLRITGNDQNAMSVWGYSLDAYAGGVLSVTNQGQTVTSPALDLSFETRNQLTFADALRSLGQALYFEGALLLLALLVWPLPGCLLLLAYHLRFDSGSADAAEQGDSTVWPWDPAAWIAVALALGLAAWALLWLWWSLPGLRWSAGLLWGLLVVGWSTVLWLFWRERSKLCGPPHGDEAMHCRPFLPWHRDHILLALILAAGLAVRLIAVRDIAFPPWVDSSRHALITAVMASSGQAIKDYGSYLPVDRFPYHYGFHALSATLSMLSRWPLDRLLIYLAQLINALIPLAVYGGAWLFVRRRGPALFAAFLVALPFFFPAYYATWGRMTQLAAVFILPVLLALTWQLLSGERGWQRSWWLVGLLAAGMFMIHLRVFAYTLPYFFLAWALNLGRRTLWLLAAGGLGLLLILPRAVQLFRQTEPASVLATNISNYNAFPTSYLEAGWERPLVVVAFGALLIVLIGALWRKKWALVPLALAAWVAVLFLLLAGKRLGLPEPALLNINSMYITLFVPLALFLATVAAPIWDFVHRQVAGWRSVVYLLGGAALAALILFGIRQQIAILNPQTILAKPEDVPALLWLDENLPPDARIAVNSWQWLGETWAAADGGAWIVPLTGRMSSTPPVDHIYSNELFNQVRQFNQEAKAMSDWSQLETAEWLQDQGMTHIFVGKSGGFFDPAALRRNDGLHLLYDHDGVYIFALEAMGENN